MERNELTTFTVVSRCVLRRVVYIVCLVGAVVVCLPLYALPAVWTLPRGRRPGLAPLTISDAAAQLCRAYPPGASQIEAARSLVGSRMIYSRRNSFDPYSLAFARGYGYCQQMSLALANLLCQMGYSAKVVHCMSCRFDDSQTTPHSWVQVRLADESLELDPVFWNEEGQTLDFEALGKVMDFTRIWRILGGWGSTAINAHRYYQTGVDL